MFLWRHPAFWAALAILAIPFLYASGDVVLGTALLGLVVWRLAYVSRTRPPERRDSENAP